MNLFEQYGIKEVADAIFYDLATGEPVMFFDTLKVSTIETTGETVDGRGGKGNPKLISWDFNKEITLTLQDALMSPKSLELLLGKGKATVHADVRKIRKAQIAQTRADASGLEFDVAYVPVGGKVKVIDLAAFQATVTANVGLIPTANIGDLTTGDVIRIAYEVNAAANSVYELVIGPNTFAGTYMIVADTVIRNKTTGIDEGFQFIVPKAKFGTDVSFTLEAEGDPTVFDMTMTVLKADNGSMMSLVKYDIGEIVAGVDYNVESST